MSTGEAPDKVRTEVVARITAYLTGGGLFNPELANHDAVRNLLIDARAALQGEQSPGQPSGDGQLGHAGRASAADVRQPVPAGQTLPSPLDPTEQSPAAGAVANERILSGWATGYRQALLDAKAAPRPEDAALTDAARYRWLRERPTYRGEALDALIDVARQEADK